MDSPLPNAEWARVIARPPYLDPEFPRHELDHLQLRHMFRTLVITPLPVVAKLTYVCACCGAERTGKATYCRPCKTTLARERRALVATYSHV